MKQSAIYTVLLTVLMTMLRLSSAPHNDSIKPAPTALARPAVRHAQSHVRPSEGARASGGKNAKYTHACSALLPAKIGAPTPEDPERGAAGRMIDDFLHEENLDRSPGSRATSIQIVIALAPDPVHTNLGLMFDREMTAVEQAAQAENYAFSSSWLPWHTDAPAVPQNGNSIADSQDACPGILLFRQNVPTHVSAESRASEQRDDKPFAQGLLVFIVGENPTAGLNRDQWDNAIAWMSDPRRPRSTLRVLGPSFSGSLPSLAHAVESLEGRKDLAGFLPAIILSGSVSTCSSMAWFQNETGKAVLFGSFQDNDDLRLYRFSNYLRKVGATPTEGSIAILSEDETVHGNLGHLNPVGATTAPENSPQNPLTTNCSFHYHRQSPHDERPLLLFYPRDISALRTAYQTQSIFSSAGSSHIHTNLQEDAETAAAGSQVTDSIASFSGNTEALAQEARLFAIVNFLRTHHSRYVILRATNPLDLIFLTRFVHRSYPEGRIVSDQSDDLFGREVDTTEFRGTMAISNYPLLPANQHWTQPSQPPDHVHFVFDSDVAEGTYFAARYLFDREMKVLSICAPTFPCRLPYKPDLVDLADPSWLYRDQVLEAQLVVPTWVSVVGVAGYWPVAVLTTATFVDQDLTSESNHHSTAIRVVPLDYKYTGRDRTLLEVLSAQPTSWQLCLLIALGIYTYHLIALAHGSSWTSLGLFGPFRNSDTKQHQVLLGVSSSFIVMLPAEFLSVLLSPPGLTPYVEKDWPFRVGLTAIALLSLLPAIALFWRSVQRNVEDPGAGSARFCSPTLLSYLTSLAILLMLAWAGLLSGLDSATAYPTFYRMAHLMSGVSPLVPTILLTIGFYLWSWQALAGSALLCCGRPLLPDLPGDTCDKDGRYRNRENFCISSGMTSSIEGAASFLGHSSIFISMAAASILLAALLYSIHGLPLLGLENRRFALVMNIGLFSGVFFLSGAAVRLRLTWIQLRRLLHTLSSLHLNGTLCQNTMAGTNSLWSVSGSVQRIQLLFFSQQLEAARRLLQLRCVQVPSLQEAVEAASRFAERSAQSVAAGPQWHLPVELPVADGPYIKINKVFVREAMNKAAAEILTNIFLPGKENLDGLSEHATKRLNAAEDFLSMHFVAYLQNILATLRSVVLAIGYLFMSICLTISFYPFIPRTAISIWLILLLAGIGSVVLSVYAGMERDVTLSVLTGTDPKLSSRFWIKSAAFLSGPLLGILTTQFPGIADFVLSWLQPGLESIGK